VFRDCTIDALLFIFKPASVDLFPQRKLAALISGPELHRCSGGDSKVVDHIYAGMVKRAENEFHRADS
jgi:hypothetical protein